MLKFDANLKYASPVVIIDFGPDDPEAERQRSTGKCGPSGKHEGG